MTEQHQEILHHLKQHVHVPSVESVTSEVPSEDDPPPLPPTLDSFLEELFEQSQQDLHLLSQQTSSSSELSQSYISSIDVVNVRNKSCS